MNVSLDGRRHVHLVGVGGAGMSAIASVLADAGHLVTGSDLKASVAFERLEARGLGVVVGHRAEHVTDPATTGAAVPTGQRPDFVARSSAVGDSNVEVAAARLAGIPVCSRADILAAVCRLRRTLAVAGTHGKTTTSSMLALILDEAGCRPSFVVGGDVNEIGSGAVWAGGEWLVVEADESDGSFLQLDPEAAVVTSVEADHLEHYRSLMRLHAAFEDFLASLPGFAMVCADDPWGARFAARHPDALSYGTGDGASLRLDDVVSARSTVDFTLARRGGDRVRVRLPVPGLHNAANAAAAMGAAEQLGVPLVRSAQILAHYGGVARRYEFRGAAAGVTFIDDYAHLPGEVAAVLAAARAGGWRRIVCVYQPHRYTRTAALWRDFATAFAAAELVVLTDVYAAGEPPQPGVSGKLLVDALLEAEPYKRVAWLPHRGDLHSYLLRELRPGDLCLTLNAGDLTTLPAELIEALG
ncbi:MAG: UDP-N-acetylmuramate--L-alanine ligase [bacterium]|nr:UDP-N-acetylmuramate--L-alanine ligase [bacterium]MDE0667657.1 UDP-N-acetylmuramate--L-alanine ligase [bacterium]MYB23753.1 UDP-N-acetylmuramate--L-alanine ligase [Acidimicrobiia bacterium]